MRNSTVFAIAALGLAALIGQGCGSKDSGSTSLDGPKVSSAGDGASVDAQGSTFIQPFLVKAFDEYKKTNNFHVNYTGGGSAAGIKGVSEGVIAFGASDVPMKEEEIQKAGKKILNLPLIIGAIPIIYNVPGVQNGLKLDGPVLADIFMTKITKWNDAKIVALNPDLKLPDLPIVVQARADGSGTTYVVSDYLSHVSSEWKTKMGVNKTLNWSEKVQKWKGSEGVANNTKSTAGSISYVELSWAQKASLTYAALKNKDGKFVLADSKGATAAADKVPLPADMRVSIVDAPGADSYPISTYSFGLVPEDLTKQKNAADVIKSLKFVVGDAQKFASDLGYAPLPEKVAKSVSDLLDTVKVK